MPEIEVGCVGELDQKIWKLLLGRISDDRCTPILGPELSFGSMTARSAVAGDWARDLEFPFEEKHDLPRVAQYSATMNSEDDTKREFVKRFTKAVAAPNPDDPEDPYRILAHLPFPLYLTTNYDSFLFQALERNSHKKPLQEFCRWKDIWEDRPSAFGPSYQRHVAQPVVFHIYGHMGVPDSLVLTEDDYLNFLGGFSADPKMLPPALDKMKQTALLFLGYRLRDLNFRVLLRFLKLNQSREPKKVHLCVQMAEDPADPNTQRGVQAIHDYLEESCDQLRINVYFGTSRQFLRDLSKIWKEQNRED